MTNIELIEICRDGTIAKQQGEIPEAATEICGMMTGLYTAAGFVPPWTGYLAYRNAQAVGTCAFKSPPRDGVVEIAYQTFEVFEGQGIATEMAARLTEIACNTDPAVRVQARTLPEESASTTVLRRNGFVHRGAVEDPDDGTVWLWEFDKP